jgi:hypothetical protein
MNRRDFTLGGLTASLAALIGNLMGGRIRAAAPKDLPEERDFGGLARAITIGIPADASPYWPKLVIQDSFGAAIELVQGLELAIDAQDMLFKGHMTRMAADEIVWDGPDHDRRPRLRPGGEPKLVREPVVVARFDTLPPSPRS